MVQLVQALRHKPKGCGFDFGGFIKNFNVLNPSSPIMALGLTQPLREMSTSGISWEVKVAGAYGSQPCLEILRDPTLLRPKSLCRPVMG